MSAILATLLLLPPLQPTVQETESGPLVTKWAAAVEAGDVVDVYPRPTMLRERWLSLNDRWDYAVTDGDAESVPERWEGRIRVPFAIETHLSGVERRLAPDQRLWYRRLFAAPQDWSGSRVLLHFGAVDWEAEVRVDGETLIVHHGGYDSFTVDVTESLAGKAGPCQLVVAVRDPTDEGGQARGKQVSNPGGIYYTPTTGIWQTVWLEPVPVRSIESLKIVPSLAGASVSVAASVSGDAAGLRVTAEAVSADQTVATASAPVGEPVVLSIPEPHAWSPDDPHLYTLRVRLETAAGELVDSVESYTGLRDVALGEDDEGRVRILLNGEPLLQIGMLDQGYWPDGGLTAPSDEALRFDVGISKRYGFNLLRKHVKVEPERWYRWCDELGMLVWQDMPNGNNGSPEDQARFRAELERMIVQRGNHPSIVMWVPFNEGWGQHDTAEVVDLVRRLDPSRLVNQASGWHERGVGDVIDLHAYPGPVCPDPDGERALVLGEFGGLGLTMPGHMWQEEAWGYRQMGSSEELVARYESLLAGVHQLARDKGLSAAVYTQVSDVETEANGLVTYDRGAKKAPSKRIEMANAGYLPPTIDTFAPVFIEAATVELSTFLPGAEIRYTLDGGLPNARSMLYEGAFEVRGSGELVARAFWPDGKTSFPSRFALERVEPMRAHGKRGKEPGLVARVFEGAWTELPDFATLPPVETMIVPAVDLTEVRYEENFGIRFDGVLTVPRTGVYRISCSSDDGSRVHVADRLAVDNDGVHGDREIPGALALEAGSHALRVEFFQGVGGKALALWIEGPELERQRVPTSMLSCDFD